MQVINKSLLDLYMCMLGVSCGELAPALHEGTAFGRLIVESFGWSRLEAVSSRSFH